jgi:hypothetical protein
VSLTPELKMGVILGSSCWKTDVVYVGVRSGANWRAAQRSDMSLDMSLFADSVETAGFDGSECMSVA